MPPLFQVTERSIRNLLEDVINRFKGYDELIVAPSNYIPKIIEICEIYIKIQGNREFYGWLAYDAENKYLIDVVTGKRDDDTLEERFKKLKKYKGKTELVLIDAYKGYGKFIEKYLTDGEKKPLTGVINKLQYTKTEGFVTYALFGQSKQSVENKMASLGLGGKITTALIECLNSQIRDLCNYRRRRSKRIPRFFSWGEKAISGFKFLHNFLKAHLTLSGKSSKNWITVPVTPCMKAGFCNHQISLIEILNFRF
jgi:IS1 family transposase